jgi:hypothetical protein
MPLPFISGVKKTRPAYICRNILSLCMIKKKVSWYQNTRFVKKAVFGSNYRCEQVFSLMTEVRSRTRTRLNGAHLMGCMQIATGIKPDIEKLRKQNILSDISLMTYFVREYYWVMCGPVCNSKLIAFFFYKFPWIFSKLSYNLSARESISKCECDLRSGKVRDLLFCVVANCETPVAFYKGTKLLWKL